jgi:hypothetical protein
MIADAHAQRLLATLVPLHAYASRGRERADLSAYQFNHICEIEAALNAAADLLEALDPPPTPLMLHVRRVLAFHADPVALTPAKLRAHFPNEPHHYPPPTASRQPPPRQA